MAQAEYHRRRSIARGTTSTTAPQGTHRKRRHGTVSVAGVPPASVGPSIHRVRSPCPCSRKLAPAGRLAAWHPGHCFGRTSSGDGGLASHLLTSSSLCTIRLGPRSLSAIQPGATMGTVLRAPVPITISGAETIPAPRPPPSAAAHYITVASQLQAPVADGAPIATRARRHQEVGALTPPSSAISSRGNTGDRPRPSVGSGHPPAPPSARPTASSPKSPVLAAGASPSRDAAPWRLRSSSGRSPSQASSPPLWRRSPGTFLRKKRRTYEGSIYLHTPHDWLLPRTAAVIHHGGSGRYLALRRTRRRAFHRDSVRRCHSPGGWGHVSPGPWGQVTGIEDLGDQMPQVGLRVEPGGALGADVRPVIGGVPLPSCGG
jgi:hypothetical protein